MLLDVCCLRHPKNNAAGMMSNLHMLYRRALLSERIDEFLELGPIPWGKVLFVQLVNCFATVAQHKSTSDSGYRRVLSAEH